MVVKCVAIAKQAKRVIAFRQPSNCVVPLCFNRWNGFVAGATHRAGRLVGLPDFMHADFATCFVIEVLGFTRDRWGVR